jgi:hypothetical protein
LKFLATGFVNLKNHILCDTGFLLEHRSSPPPRKIFYRCVVSSSRTWRRRPAAAWSLFSATAASAAFTENCSTV